MKLTRRYFPHVHNGESSFPFAYPISSVCVSTKYEADPSFLLIRLLLSFPPSLPLPTFLFLPSSLPPSPPVFHLFQLAPPSSSLPPTVDGFYVAKFKVSRMPKKTRLALESEADAELEPPEEFVPLPTSIDEEEKLERQAADDDDATKKAVKFDDAEDQEIIEGSSFPPPLFLFFLFFLFFPLLFDPCPVLPSFPRSFLRGLTFFLDPPGPSSADYDQK
jgi:hypothetical protein